ncbi:molybdopterin-dependent oxidoreductase [Acidothermaceae bacterium B102]|nr:molybdopterin-dependent oxidoreductase [Acidothermaceae bacterium B102]
MPPEQLRVGPLKEGAFTSRLRDERVASWLGLWLGIAFTVCLVTGLIDWDAQLTHPFIALPQRPARFFQYTQGIHVATGIASIPLLLAKLWTVYPKLWEWPPARTIAHALERGTLLVLVGGAVFETVSGLLNIIEWYPWPFFFPTTHFWVAWLTIGALIVHIGTKASVTRRGLSRLRADESNDDALERRTFMGAITAATGAVTITTIGQTLRPLTGLDLLAPKKPTIGAQGLPVRATASGAGVTKRAADPAYRLIVSGAVSKTLSLDVATLHAMELSKVTLPIACVDGWSATTDWSGISIPTLLAMAGARPGSRVRIESLEKHGLYSISYLDGAATRNPDVLLATHIKGEVLHMDHGYPLRLIAPDRPGVLQTKWVTKVVVL